ncbi:MAG: hypothetical protein ABI340_00920, partial [Nitrososphaera sp.]
QSTTISLTDSLPSSDSIAAPKAVVNSVSDPLSLSDPTVSTTKAKIVSISDSTSINDVISTAVIYSQSISDSTSINDIISTSVTRSPSLSDSTTLTDSLSTLKIGASQYLVPNDKTTVTLNSTKPNLVIQNSNALLSTVSIPSVVTTPTIDYFSIISGNTVHVSTSLNITKDVNGDGIPEIIVTMPSNVDITGTGWNGVLQLQKIQSTSPTLPAPQGQVATAKTEIGLGSTIPLTFNHAVRIYFAKEAGYHVGYFHLPSAVTETIPVCSGDSQAAGDALPVGGSCKIDVGPDLVVWTNHSTGWVTWTLSPSPPQPTPQQPSIPTSLGGGYGTGISTQGAIGAGTLEGALAVPVTLYDVTYDRCEQNMVKITVGSSDQTVPRVLVTTPSGITEAKVSSSQPYAELYNLTQTNVLVYDAPLKAQTSSFQLLIKPENGTGYITTSVDVIKCKDTIVFREVPLPSKYNPNTPKIFDVKIQLDNQSKTSSLESQDEYITNQTLTISGIISSPVSIDHSEIRLTKFGENQSQYVTVNAQISPLSIPRTYLVYAEIPKEYLVSPAMSYWIWTSSTEGLESESDHYSIGVLPPYEVKSKVSFEMPQTVQASSTQSPVIYIQNNVTGPIYGTVSLLVNNTEVSSYAHQLFDNGTYVIQLDWSVPRENVSSTYPVKVVANFYGKSYESNEAQINSYTPTITMPLSNIEPIKSFTDKQGNLVAGSHILYSSLYSKDNTKFKVTSPSGTCVIGQTSACLVDESTISGGGRYSDITIDGKAYFVYYSGSDSVIQRFTITSSEPIEGKWNVIIEKNGIEQKDMEKTAYLKVKYLSENNQVALSLPKEK